MPMPPTDQLDYLMDGHASLPIAGLPKAAAKQLQELLNCVGYRLTVDGIIGPASMEAFGSWKASADQNQPDVIGKGSLGLLKEEAKQRIEGTAQPEAVVVQYSGKEFFFPTVGMVRTDQPIIPGGSFSFGEASHNNTRKVSEPVAKEVIRMAKLMQPYRDRVGRPWRITSWVRDEAANRACGGAKNSQHLYGRGVDIAIQGETGRSMLNLFGRDWYNAGIGGVGIYTGVPNIIHLDCRGVRANWGW